MVKQLEFIEHKKKKEEYVITHYLNEGDRTLCKSNKELNVFDYFTIVASAGNTYTLVCWNEEDNQTDRIVYLAEKKND